MSVCRNFIYIQLLFGSSYEASAHLALSCGSSCWPGFSYKILLQMSGEYTSIVHYCSDTFSILIMIIKFNPHNQVHSHMYTIKYLLLFLYFQNKIYNA